MLSGHKGPQRKRVHPEGRIGVSGSSVADTQRHRHKTLTTYRRTPTRKHTNTYTDTHGNLPQTTFLTSIG